MPAADLLGRRIGAYKLVSLMGEGGMGAVYVGENESLGRKVAVKVLHPEFAAQPGITQRFFNEARAANLIRHPSIVDIHEFGEAPEVGAYIIMELLDGMSLAVHLQRRGRLEPYEAVRIVQRIASALGAAHARGIVHRDLKPDNIYLISDPDHPGEDRVKILDFGIAKLIEDGERRGARTRTGAVLGTPLYMSPEQADGARTVDARTDIYALGVVAYEMLCGRPPFVADGYGHVLAMHLMQAPPPPSQHVEGLPLQLEAAVLRALSKDPGARFGSMDEMSKAFGAALQDLRPTLRDAAAQVPREAVRTDLRDPAYVVAAGDRTEPGELALAMTHPTPPPDVARGAMAAPAQEPPRKRPSTLASSAAELGFAPPARRRWVIPAVAIAVATGAGGAGAALWLTASATDPVEEGEPEGADAKLAMRPADTEDDGDERERPDPTSSATAAPERMETADGAPRSSMPTADPRTAAPTRKKMGTAARMETAAATPAPAGMDTAAPAPATVTIRIESTPPGAEVILKGTMKVIGTTPLEITRPREDREVVLVLRKSGYTVAPAIVSLRRDGVRRVVLRAKGAPPGTAGPDDDLPVVE